MSTEESKYPAFERVLAYTTVLIIAVSVAAYLTTLIVAMVAGREVLAHGLWQTVVFISYVGLPVGFVLLMVLLGTNFRRRAREK